MASRDPVMYEMLHDISSASSSVRQSNTRNVVKQIVCRLHLKFCLLRFCANMVFTECKLSCSVVYITIAVFLSVIDLIIMM